MQKRTNPGNIWPRMIIGYFTLAIIAAVIFVAWAVRQNIDLVRDDYYAEELRFQKQIERVDRTKNLKTAASVVYDYEGQRVTVTLPADHAAHAPEGRIQFYRPSDASLDHSLKLELAADGTQRVPTGTLRTGLWKVRLHWKVNGEEFYTDSSIVVAPKES